MSNLDEARKSMQAFIDAAMREPAAGVHYVDWSDVVWSVDAPGPISERARANRLHFRTRPAADRSRRPITGPFGSFMRAMCWRFARGSLDGVRFHVLSLLVVALAHLHDSLPPDRVSDPVRFVGLDFDNAVDRMISLGFKPSVIGNWASKLDWVAKEMDRRGLTEAPLQWERSYFFDFESQYTPAAIERKRQQKLLCNEDMLLWARLSADPGPDPFDRLCQRAVDLMVCGNFRINEVLSLPHDALVREPRLDDEGLPMVDARGEVLNRVGLRHWPSKSAGAPLIKAVPSVMGPVAERAVADVLRLSRRPRAVALAYARGTTPFNEAPWNLLDSETRLHPQDVALLIGYADEEKRYYKGREFIRSHNIPHTIERGVDRAGRPIDIPVVLLRDLEETLHRISFGRERLASKHGEIPMDQCLFVVHRNVGSTTPVDGTARLLTRDVVDDYLRKRFPRSRFLLDVALAADTPAGGNPSSHMFRFWLNTEALERNVPQMDLAVWSGRLSVGSNRPYDLRSPEVRAGQLGKKSEAGKGDGKIVAVAAPGYAADIPAGRSGHATSLGHCRLPISGAPCSYVRSAADSGSYASSCAFMRHDELDDLIAALESLVASDARELASKRAKADAWLATNGRLLQIALSVREGRPLPEGGHAEAVS